jgi:hypothetical protein
MQWMKVFQSDSLLLLKQVKRCREEAPLTKGDAMAVSFKAAPVATWRAGGGAGSEQDVQIEDS